MLSRLGAAALIVVMVVAAGVLLAQIGRGQSSMPTTAATLQARTADSLAQVRPTRARPTAIPTLMALPTPTEEPTPTILPQPTARRPRPSDCSPIDDLSC
jgi:hypothetical protein